MGAITRGNYIPPLPRWLVLDVQLCLFLAGIYADARLNADRSIYKTKRSLLSTAYKKVSRKQIHPRIVMGVRVIIVI